MAKAGGPSGSASAVSPDPHGLTMGAQPPPRRPPGERPPPAKKAKLKLANIVDGRYATSRNNHPLCPGFNAGTCTTTVRGVWCAANPTMMHLCNICLGTHGSFDRAKCGHESIPSTSATKAAAKGGGRGGGAKGWGKGGGKCGKGKGKQDKNGKGWPKKWAKTTPKGQNFCAAFHQNGNCRFGSQCRDSHNCPVMSADGWVCNKGDHRPDRCPFLSR